ncbi:U32 family peptidase [Methanohalophilus sp.]
MAKHTEKINSPEILSPAGNYDALLGAIKGGSDAVYLGVGEFNARQGASNFTPEEMENAIDIAHLHGISVYLAFNVPLKETEPQDAIDIIDRAYAAGIDAVIMRDFGFIDLVKKNYPDLPIHGSTQLNTNNTETVKFLKTLGLSRIIVARELDTAELKHIIDSTDMDIEIFAHGALCYSYSGQCLFSSFAANRSANRGACAQPCRWKFDLFINGKDMNHHIGGVSPISCAELCTLPGLEELINTGIKSLKIEGRMKRAEYVTASSEIYKETAEIICQDKKPDSNWLKEKENDLAKIFYRGFTRGFVLGDRNVTHPEYSSSYGAFLGKIRRVKRSKNAAKVKLNQTLEVNDGISIHTKQRMLGSKVEKITVDGGEVEVAEKGSIPYIHISPKTVKSVKTGDDVYLNTDISLLEEMGKRDVKKVPVNFHIRANIDRQLEITASAGDIEALHVSDYLVQEPKKAPTSVEQITDIIKRLGDTPYIADEIELKGQEDIFIPLGELTRARRSVVEKLQEKQLEIFHRQPKNPKLPASKPEDKIPDKLLLSVEVADIEGAKAAADSGADIIYIPADLFDKVENDKDLGQKIKRNNIEIVLKLPAIINEDELGEWTDILGKIKTRGYTVGCGEPGTLRLAHQMEIKCVALKNFTVFNSLTANVLEANGASCVILSPELTLQEIQNIVQASANTIKFEAIAYGRQQLLVTEHDLLKPIVDKGFYDEDSNAFLQHKKTDRYPVKRWRNRTVIYDSHVINMLNNIDDMKNTGIDVLRLEFPQESHRKVAIVVSEFKKILDGKGKKSIPESKVYSRGLYYTGI